MNRYLRTNYPQKGTEADPDCIYIASELREKWGNCHVYLEWNEKRQQLEATIYHKMPVWRYKFSHMNRIGGMWYSIERTDTDVWYDAYLSKAEVGNEYRPSKGNWIMNSRVDVELDANDTKELWAAAIDKEMEECFGEVGQFLSMYHHGLRENPYPAPKGNTVDWDWNDED